MKASTCSAKVCFTLRRMTAVSEEEPFFCFRTADLLALRTLLFMDAMIPQSPGEDNARVQTQRSRLAQSRWPIGLASLLEFFHMTSEGWAEFGGKDCFSVGRNAVLDLLDGFLQLFDQSLA